MATKVKLLKRALKGGNRHSLYLDFYPPIEHPKTGKPTRREYLGIHLLDKPKTALEKNQNKELLMQAEMIAARRQNELHKEEIYTPLEKEYLKTLAAEKKRAASSFIEFYEGMVRVRKGTNYDNWVSSLIHLRKFTNGHLTFGEVNERFCSDFRRYLLRAPSNRGGNTTLAKNSVYSYFNKFKAALKQAYREKLLTEDLGSTIEGVKEEETHRTALTMEELKLLIDTECKSQTLKQAALFAAMTGLRYSDIHQLTWQNIEHIEGKGYFIRFRQQKTGGLEFMPISETAVLALGPEGEPNERPFKGLKSSTNNNLHLKNWVSLSGITKKVTFHCFRHTFAGLQLDFGTDIVTISKMLGHKDIKTTMIYLKGREHRLREAADRIKLEM